MPESSAAQSAQNYELLIRLDEQMKNLAKDVRELNNTTGQRISVLDAVKYNKEEAIRTFAEVEKVTGDHEVRIRKVEKAVEQTQTQMKTWGTVFAVVIGLLQIIQIVSSLSNTK